MFKKYLKNNSGFTLIEILIVVIVIGVLAGLAIGNYGNIVDRAKTAEAKTILLNGYAGYQRMMFDNEPVNGGNRLTWPRMGMENPATLVNRHFTYTILPNTAAPTELRATFIKDNTKYVEVALADGCLTSVNF